MSGIPRPQGYGGSAYDELGRRPYDLVIFLGVLPQTPACEAIEVLEEVVYKSLISFSFFFAIKQ